MKIRSQNQQSSTGNGTSKIISPAEFDFEWFSKIKKQPRTRGNQGTSRNKWWYKDIVTAFDIETTRLPEIEQAIMYVWQWQIGLDVTVMGRTWDEFIWFRDRLRHCMKPDEKLCCYVHNLSYEFQFLRGIYEFSPEDVFALKSRKVLKCEMREGDWQYLEFRCSYIHSNMALSVFLSKMGAEHGKLSGAEYDYKKRRFPWTPLSEREKEYCQNDVLGLVEALTIEMAHDKDNLYKIPLTSTGYVRRDAKLAMRMISHTAVKEIVPDLELYTMLREAFRGGNTHANRYYAGKVLHNVHSADRSSSYPDVQCNCKFPVSRFFHIGPCSFDTLQDLIVRRGKAVIMRCGFTNVRLRNEFWGCPYISRDRCRNVRGALFDNGRILSADYLETTITDIDLKIFMDEYDWDDMVSFDVAYARYGRLPQPLVDVTNRYYRLKTELKNVPGQELLYLKSKNKLNSIYGMMATDPVKQTIDFINGDFSERNEPPEELLEKSNKRAFLAYQWGVWVTAWARYRLEEGIKLAGENFVYADTDSVKYLGEIDWSEYNRQRVADSVRSGAHATDPNGIEHYMGVFEQEADMCEFSTMGAKKYCYRETPDSPLCATIAGVRKDLWKHGKLVIKGGGAELESAGGIKAFREGFIFHAAGGTELVYNDIPPMTEYQVEGHILPITSNVVIRDSTYTLGMTGDYRRLLDRAHKLIDFQRLFG